MIRCSRSDSNPSVIMGNTSIFALVTCADPDGIVVGIGDTNSPVQVTNTGELRTITPGSMEITKGTKVDAGGKVTNFTEAIPPPPPPPTCFAFEGIIC